jgi:hypothetical protein
VGERHLVWLFPFIRGQWRCGLREDEKEQVIRMVIGED